MMFRSVEGFPLFFPSQPHSLVDAYVEVSALCGTEMQGSGTHPGPNKDENGLRVQRHSPCLDPGGRRVIGGTYLVTLEYEDC